MHSGLAHHRSPRRRCHGCPAIATGWRTRRGATKPTCTCGTGTPSPCSRCAEHHAATRPTHPAHAHRTAWRAVMHPHPHRRRQRATRRPLRAAPRGRRRRRAPPLSPSTGSRTATGRPSTARRGSQRTRLRPASAATSCASLTRAVRWAPAVGPCRPRELTRSPLVCDGAIASRERSPGGRRGHARGAGPRGGPLLPAPLCGAHARQRRAGLGRAPPGGPAGTVDQHDAHVKVRALAADGRRLAVRCNPLCRPSPAAGAGWAPQRARAGMESVARRPAGCQLRRRALRQAVGIAGPAAQPAGVPTRAAVGRQRGDRGRRHPGARANRVPPMYVQTMRRRRPGCKGD